MKNTQKGKLFHNIERCQSKEKENERITTIMILCYHPLRLHGLNIYTCTMCTYLWQRQVRRHCSHVSINVVYCLRGASSKAGNNKWQSKCKHHLAARDNPQWLVGNNCWNQWWCRSLVHQVNCGRRPRDSWLAYLEYFLSPIHLQASKRFFQMHSTIHCMSAIAKLHSHEYFRGMDHW